MPKEKEIKKEEFKDEMIKSENKHYFECTFKRCTIGKNSYVGCWFQECAILVTERKGDFFLRLLIKLRLHYFIGLLIKLRLYRPKHSTVFADCYLEKCHYEGGEDA